MTSLIRQDQRHLDAAEGWLGLGDWPAANEELDRISPQIRGHPEVLSVRWRVYSMAEKWELAFAVARSVSEKVPDASFGYFHMAIALHKMKRTNEALELLLSVADRFEDNYMMRYTLACYACQLGKLEEARNWLKKAFDLPRKAELREIALHDPDLEPLWANIGTL